MNEEVKTEEAAKPAEPELTPEQKAKKEAFIKRMEELGKLVARLNPAQRIALALGLPFELPKNRRSRKKRFSYRTFRSPGQLAVKKKEHAKRVGRPK